MDLYELPERPEYSTSKRTFKRYQSMDQLLEALSQRDLPANIVEQVNDVVVHVDSYEGTAKAVNRNLVKGRSKIVKLVEKEMKIVPKNHYRTTWMVLGMSAFGIPLGVAFSASMGNWGFIGIGMPIGMAIGIAVGTQMDKKAFDDGRQIEVELS